MGLFNKLGRKVQELKQEVDDAKAGHASHRCASCDELLHTDLDACPECGADAVVAIDT